MADTGTALAAARRDPLVFDPLVFNPHSVCLHERWRGGSLLHAPFSFRNHLRQHTISAAHNLLALHANSLYISQGLTNSWISSSPHETLDRRRPSVSSSSASPGGSVGIEP